jgi:branched-chain amino acid transport system permease protein
MRRIVFIALGVAAAVLAAPSSRADETAPTQAWSRTTPVPTFLAAANRLYVAADLGKESARTYVDMPGLATGTTLRVAEVTSGSTLADAATIEACPLTTPIVGTGEVASDVAPAVDCSASVPVTRGTDGIWSVPLDTFVARWKTAPTLGLALIATPTGTTTYRVAFDATKTALVLPAPTAAIAPADTSTPAPEPSAPAFTPSPPSAATTPVGTMTAAAAPTVTTNATQKTAAPIEIGPVKVVTPSPFVVLTLVAIGAFAISLCIGRRRPTDHTPAPDVPIITFGWGAGAVALCLLPALLDETTVYKVGLVLIVLVAAIGLHVLVNWAGELSLAHATLVGLPAFVVAKISSEHGVSPLLLLPVGVAVGLVAGAVVGLPAIRARGLQVALVTLAAGVAIDRFFFTKEWLVGSVSSPPVATPSLGPLTFDSSRALYPVLALTVVVAIAIAWAIYRSKLGRALLWIKAQPDAAAAFGIPVARYRAVAYALAGGFAGLAGGLTTVWVQRLTPEAFPLSRSFTFLIIVALAGRGFVGGVALAAAAVEGGTLFLANGDAFITYAAPIGLLLTLTKHPTGLNGFGRQLAARVRALTTGRTPTMKTTRLAIRPLLALGTVTVAVGFTAIVLAWYHSGNTSQVWIQNQEMILGGIGGLSLVIVGVGLVIYDRLLASRAAESEKWDRMFAALVEEGPRRRPLEAARKVSA